MVDIKFSVVNINTAIIRICIKDYYSRETGESGRLVLDDKVNIKEGQGWPDCFFEGGLYKDKSEEIFSILNCFEFHIYPDIISVLKGQV